jgi:hypothetical protein
VLVRNYDITARSSPNVLWSSSMAMEAFSSTSDYASTQKPWSEVLQIDQKASPVLSGLEVSPHQGRPSSQYYRWACCGDEDGRRDWLVDNS